uniref:Uncharacterized protein n=1 Tax=Arundo donax TaxID=35708 RepID=A0A0A9EKC4_ARUDO
MPTALPLHILTGFGRGNRQWLLPCSYN